MKLWLVKFEEDLPIDEAFYPFRMSMLADGLLEAGHEVVRWASDFNHKHRKSRFGCRHTVEMSDSYHIELLPSFFDYKNSHSANRFLSMYWQSFLLLRAFRQADKPPDAMVVAMPTPIACFVTALYCRWHKVPFFIDARDMWPDILFDELKGIKKVMAFPVYILMYLELRFAVKHARGLLAITDPFVQFLLNYRRAPKSSADASFPIGFRKISYQHSEQDERHFWASHSVTFDPEDFIIYFAGTFSKTVLVEMPKVATAMRELSRRKPNIKLVLCGRGNSEADIKSHFHNLPNVIFPGHVSAYHLAYLKSKSQIALMAIEKRKDYLNSLSNKFFDYAGGGLPIVTNLAGIPRAVLEAHKAGFFYDSAEGLVDIVERLTNDPVLLDKTSENTRKMFENKFEASRVYKSFVRHLEENLVS